MLYWYNDRNCMTEMIHVSLWESSNRKCSFLLKVTINKDVAEELIRQFEPCPTVKEQGMMALDGEWRG